MTHQRQTIREAAVTILKNALIVGDRVYSNRTYKLEAASLPAIVVTSASEQSEVFETCSDTLQRTLSLAVDCYASDPVDESLDDTLDALAESVEAAMKVDPTIGSTANNSFLESTEIFTTEDGREPIGMIRLTFSVTYFY